MDFSYQLYSARNAGSLDETLKTLKQLGYTQVEGWGGQFADPAALAAEPQERRPHHADRPHGLRPSSRTPTRPLKIADTLGIKTVFCPAPPSADYREGKGELARARRRRSAKIADGLQGRRHRLRLPQPPLGVRQDRRRQDPDGADPRGRARHRVGDGPRLGRQGRRRPGRLDGQATAAASPPSTSRTSRPPARSSTRTAGPTSATAPSTGRQLLADRQGQDQGASISSSSTTSRPTRSASPGTRSPPSSSGADHGQDLRRRHHGCRQHLGRLSAARAAVQGPRGPRRRRHPPGRRQEARARSSASRR